MDEQPWQLQLVRKSLKKKEKLELLNKYLNVEPDSILLDLGCAQGILSYFLRQKGGKWISVDLDYANLHTSGDLLKTSLLQVEPGILPFKNQSFDKVISLDYLEHLENDDQCLQEINRVLKKGGEVILAVPRIGKIFLLNKLRKLLGMKMEFYGHKREGYSLKDLKSKLSKSGIEFIKQKGFSGFFSEFLELKLNFIYIHFFSPKQVNPLRDGHIRPSTPEEFNSRKKAFNLYSFIYPIVWLISKLDKIFFLQRGYGMMVWGRKPK